MSDTFVNFELDIDLSPIEEDFDRWEQLPDPKTVAALEAGLKELFGFSQSVVHHITGSLASSGKTTSETDHSRHLWTGTIEYGGSSTGVNNPVDYAWYEQRRDDAHDFMKPVQMLSDEVIGKAMEEAW